MMHPEQACGEQAHSHHVAGSPAVSWEISSLRNQAPEPLAEVSSHTSLGAERSLRCAQGISYTSVAVSGCLQHAQEHLCMPCTDWQGKIQRPFQTPTGSHHSITRLSCMPDLAVPFMP